MRTVLVSLLLVFLGGVLFCSCGKRTETYRDKYVVAGEIRRPIDKFLAHRSNPRYLVVQGRTYKGVKGLPPYYLEIPQLSSILFVTESKSGGTTFHVVNLKSKEAIEIGSPHETFGGNIGAVHANPKEPYRDFIERADQKEIVAVTVYPDAKKSFYLDLDAKKLSKIVYDSYNQSGQVTNQTVYVNGERVN